MECTIRDLKILPKVSEMAERIDTDEAYRKGEEILGNASYAEGYAILIEAEMLLKALLKRGRNSAMVKEEIGALEILAKKGGDIGKLAAVLEVINSLR